MGGDNGSGQPSSMRRMYHVSTSFEAPRAYVADGANAFLGTVSVTGFAQNEDSRDTTPEGCNASSKLIYVEMSRTSVSTTNFGQVVDPYDLPRSLLRMRQLGKCKLTPSLPLFANVSLSSDTLDVLLERGLGVDFIPQLKEPSKRQHSVAPANYRMVHGYVLLPLGPDDKTHNVVVTTQWNYSRHPDFSRKLWVVSSGEGDGVTASPVSYGSLAEAGSVVTTLPFGKGFWFGASKAAQRKAEDLANTRKVVLAVAALEQNVASFDGVSRREGILRFTDHLHTVAEELGLKRKS